jgi:hypothetical protein
MQYDLLWGCSATTTSRCGTHPRTTDYELGCQLFVENAKIAAIRKSAPPMSRPDFHRPASVLIQCGIALPQL